MELTRTSSLYRRPKLPTIALWKVRQTSRQRWREIWRALCIAVMYNEIFHVLVKCNVVKISWHLQSYETLQCIRLKSLDVFWVMSCSVCRRIWFDTVRCIKIKLSRFRDTIQLLRQYVGHIFACNIISRCKRGFRVEKEINGVVWGPYTVRI